jgi:hypothetical protein
VIARQTRRRVLDGEQVPNAEKIYSIFEPHTDLIKRGKVRTPLEFGHKVFLGESARLITQYEVLRGNPSDEDHVVPSLRRHKKVFGSAPKVYGSDRGFFSEKNVAVCVREWASRWRASLSVAVRKHSSVQPLRRAPRSGRGSASAPALRAVFRYYFVDVA